MAIRTYSIRFAVENNEVVVSNMRTIGREGAAAMNQVGNAANNAARNARAAHAEASTLAVSIRNVNNGLSLVLGGVVLGTYQAIKNLALLTDSYIQLEKRIQNATADTKNSSYVLSELQRIAMRSGESVDDLSKAFTGLSASGGSIKLTQQEVLKLVETMASLGVVSATGTQQAQAGMLQLTQMLSGGTVQADEFRAVLDAWPLLAPKIQESLGRSLKGLREEMEKGRITSEDMAKGIIKMFESVRGEADKQGLGLERSWRTLVTATGAFLGNIEKATGIVAGLGRAIRGMADALDTTKNEASLRADADLKSFMLSQRRLQIEQRGGVDKLSPGQFQEYNELKTAVSDARLELENFIREKKKADQTLAAGPKEDTPAQKVAKELRASLDVLNIQDEFKRKVQTELAKLAKTTPGLDIKDPTVVSLVEETVRREEALAESKKASTAATVALNREEKARAKELDEALKVMSQVGTAQDNIRFNMLKYDELLRKNLITQDQYDEKLGQVTEKVTKRADLEKDLAAIHNKALPENERAIDSLNSTYAELASRIHDAGYAAEEEAQMLIGLGQELDKEISQLSGGEEFFKGKVIDSFTSSFSDNIRDLIDGTEDFSDAINDMAQSFTAAMTEMLIQVYVVDEIKAALKGLGSDTSTASSIIGSLISTGFSLLSGVFGSTATTAASAASVGGDLKIVTDPALMATKAHGGGMVAPGGGVRVNAASMVFDNAQRYHAGGLVLSNNEVPAILKAGERVQTEAEQRNRRPFQGATVVQTFNVTSPTSNLSQQSLAQLARTARLAGSAFGGRF